MRRDFLHPWWVLTLGMWMAGCDGSPEGSAIPPAAAPGELPARARDVPVQKAVDVARVAWPDPSAIDRDVASRLSVVASEAVARAPVPVLVPRRAGLAERAVLIVRDNFYAAAIQGDGEDQGVTMNVSATRVVHRYPGMPIVRGPDRVRGGRPAFVTQNEGIWSVTFEEHGIHYVVEVECSRPGEDARCKDGAFALALASELVFVGGSFAGGGSR